MIRPVFLTRFCALPLMLLLPTSLPAQVAATDGGGQAADPAAQLSENLKALARDPFNVDALLLAGGGALAVGDANAAFGFYARAEELSPANYQAKMGLGSALTMMEKPRDALRAFDEAVSLGAPEADLLSDRGLAHDLEGDPKKAQRDYMAALKLRPSDELTRRLALSLGIAGERDAALARLEPLIKQNDQGAWRARAFILAMNGDAVGAEKIVRMVAPGDMAQSLIGFMQRLPGLPIAAKAAAVHFGTLPASGQGTQIAAVGDEFRPVDRAAAASLTTAEPERKPVVTPAADARPSRRQTRDAKLSDRASSAPPAPERAAPSPSQSRQEDVRLASVQGDGPVVVDAAKDPAKSASVVAPASAGSRPAPIFEVPAARARPITGASAPMAGSEGAAPQGVTPVSSPSPRSVTQDAEPQPPLPQIPTTPTPTPTTPTRVAEAQPSSAAPAPARTLADLVRGLELEEESAPVALPDAEKLRVLRLAAQRKAAAEEKARAEKAAEERRIAEEAAKARRNPARIWVQIATGRNTDALPQTWRQIRNSAPKALEDQRAWYVSYRQTNRLLVGPVKSSSAARDLVNDLAREGVQATIFSSDAGQEIERLSGK